MVDQKSLALPWITESDLPYGEQPRIYDTTGALIAVVGNAEIDKQDDWERNASAIVSAVNGTCNPVVAENATCKRPLQVDQLVRRLRWRSSLRGDYGQHEAALDAEAASLITSLAARVEALEAELREAGCPCPCNHRPDDFTVGQCVDADECGCRLGTPLLSEQKIAARSQQEPARSGAGHYDRDGYCDNPARGY